MTTRRGMFALIAGAVALPLTGAPAGRVVRWYASWIDGCGWVLSYRLDDETIENMVFIGPDDAAMARVATMINDYYARAA